METAARELVIECCPLGEHFGKSDCKEDREGQKKSAGLIPVRERAGGSAKDETLTRSARDTLYRRKPLP